MFFSASLSAQAGETSLWMEALTHKELAQALTEGHRAVLLPLGGFEQNGPHLTLNKHQHILRVTAGEIARQSGHMLIAPIFALTPQPEFNRQFPGTIGLNDELFYQVLTTQIEQLAAMGFTHIYLLGDSGGSQAAQAKAAKELSRQLAPVKVYHLSDYYNSTRNGQDAWLKAQGYDKADYAAHAALADSSELWAAFADAVRPAQLVSKSTTNKEALGVTGASDDASKEIGKVLLALKIKAAIAQIKAFERE